jgi:hypothetical protein
LTIKPRAPHRPAEPRKQRQKCHEGGGHQELSSHISNTITRNTAKGATGHHEGRLAPSRCPPGWRALRRFSADDGGGSWAAPSGCAACTSPALPPPCVGAPWTAPRASAGARTRVSTATSGAVRGGPEARRPPRPSPGTRRSLVPQNVREPTAKPNTPMASPTLTPFRLPGARGMRAVHVDQLIPACAFGFPPQACPGRCNGGVSAGSRERPSRPPPLWHGSITMTRKHNYRMQGP